MMHYRYLIITVLALAAGLTAAAAWGAALWLVAALGAALIAAVILLWRAVRLPLNAVQNGIYLLRSQDFASRISPPGQYDADRVAELFNHMMDTLKAERLKNREQELLLSKLIEVSSTGIAICNLDGEIVQTNHAYRQMADAQVQSVIDSLPDDSSRTVRRPDGRVYSVRRLWFMDSGFRRRFYVVYPLTDEIVNAERQVYNKMVRTIGHEVNNTLGSTMSVLESLGQGHGQGSLERLAVDSSLRSCGRLVDFVQRYAQLTKLPEPDFQLLDLVDAVRVSLPQLQYMAAATTRLELISEASERVNLDPALIERVLINLIKNAAESVGDRPDGLITIRITGRMLEVTDNGRGISDTEAQRLFTPFYSTKHPDRGLGLMLVSDILRAHGAAFSLTTSGPLTTFRIKFPA